MFGNPFSVIHFSCVFSLTTLVASMISEVSTTSLATRIESARDSTTLTVSASLLGSAFQSYTSSTLQISSRDSLTHSLIPCPTSGIFVPTTASQTTLRTTSEHSDLIPPAHTSPTTNMKIDMSINTNPFEAYNRPGYRQPNVSYSEKKSDGWRYHGDITSLLFYLKTMVLGGLLWLGNVEIGI